MVKTRNNIFQRRKKRAIAYYKLGSGPDSFKIMFLFLFGTSMAIKDCSKGNHFYSLFLSNKPHVYQCRKPLQLKIWSLSNPYGNKVPREKDMIIFPFFFFFFLLTFSLLAFLSPHQVANGSLTARLNAEHVFVPKPRPSETITHLFISLQSMRPLRFTRK